MTKVEAKEAKGKLGVLVIGVGGAVASTFITGTLSVRKGFGKPIGSLTQLATIRLGKRNENRFPKIKDVVPLADLNDLVFGGWDIFSENIYDAAKHAEVLKNEDIDVVKDELQAIKPIPAVFDQKFVKRLHGTHVKPEATRWEYAQQLREDIRKFKADNGCDRIVVMWAASTEVYIPQSKEHESLAAFEKALKENNTEVIAPSMCYAYAAISEGAPFIMGAPNLCVDIPAMWELADLKKVPISGKDYKTGQTMLKTVLAPMLKTRMLGLEGWFSTNILGNRDGEVLDDPGSFKTKEVSKLSVIDSILQTETYPELYSNIYHKVRINYYPPRKDNKEGWDNIDIVGWLGYPMQLKVDFLCRDSILAAPLCLDLVLFSDLAQRCGFHGIQSWLSFYFKSPMHKPDQVPEHDLFIQHTILKNTLRKIIGEPTLDYLD
ncbi:myo-inositol-1-phosphate synthase [Bacteroidia bacterium]|nr:myo-inositol-1-phosphate synthase [Bacteroidia bacterium]